MLKEYTLKVTCEVGGPYEDACEMAIQNVCRIIENHTGCTPEITHEEVVEVEREVESSIIDVCEAQNPPTSWTVADSPTPPQPEKEDVK